MHYSWSTEARARRVLANVSALLRPGGIFTGTMPDANIIIKKLRAGMAFCYSIPALKDWPLEIVCTGYALMKNTWKRMLLIVQNGLFPFMFSSHWQRRDSFVA
ncbi:hypothetical protein AgCh_031360 [Apium graveolens]